MMNCLPSHRHLLSLPAMVQFILPLALGNFSSNLTSILNLPILLVFVRIPLLAKHLTALFGLISEQRVKPKSGGFTLRKLSSGLMSLIMIIKIYTMFKNPSQSTIKAVQTTYLDS